MVPITLRNLMFLAVLIVGIFACNSKKAGQNENVSGSITDTISQEVTHGEYFSLPSPEEVLTFFNSRPLNYKPGVIAPANSPEKYAEYNSQLLMIGVYSADMAYLTLHFKNENLLNYYSVIQQLAEKAKINSMIDVQLFERVKNNQGNVDSLAAISRNLYLRLIAYFVDYEMEAQMLKVLYGSYIETLYLATQYIEEYETDKDLIEKIAVQKYTIENLEAMMKLYLLPEENKEIYAGVAQLKAHFDTLTVLKATPSDVKPTDGKLIIGSDEQLAMDKAQFEGLKQSVTEIRKSIIK